MRTPARDSRVSLVITLPGASYIKATPASAMLLVQVAVAIRWHFDPETSMRVCQHVPELGREGICHAIHHVCMTPSSPSPCAGSFVASTRPTSSDSRESAMHTAFATLSVSAGMGEQTSKSSSGSDASGTGKQHATPECEPDNQRPCMSYPSMVQGARTHCTTEQRQRQVLWK